MTVLLGLTARLDSELVAVALAAAQTALIYRSQRAACESLLDGNIEIGSYYLRTQAFIDGAMDASARLFSSVAGVGGSPASSLSSFPYPYPAAASSSPSELEARACVAVMTEFQVVSALGLVAFGTKPKPERKEAEEDDDDDDGDDDDDDESNDGARRRRRRLLERRGRRRGQRRRSLLHRWALFLVASSGVLRVAWTLLRSGGWERGVGGAGGAGGAGGFGGSGGSGGSVGSSSSSSCCLGESIPPGCSCLGGIGDSSSGGVPAGLVGLSPVAKFRHVFSRGVFAPF